MPRAAAVAQADAADIFAGAAEGASRLQTAAREEGARSREAQPREAPGEAAPGALISGAAAELMSTASCRRRNSHLRRAGRPGKRAFASLARCRMSMLGFEGRCRARCFSGMMLYRPGATAEARPSHRYRTHVTSAAFRREMADASSLLQPSYRHFYQQGHFDGAASEARWPASGHS